MTPIRAFAVPLTVGVSALAALPSAEATESGSGQCRLQEAKSFLKRESFVKHGQLQGREHRKAVRFRVQHYGRIEGLGFEELNPKTAFSQAASVQFMGHRVFVHEKIAPALRCVS